MLRQAALEELAQRALRGILVGARGAPLEVGSDLAPELRGELSPMLVEQIRSDVLAVHHAISRSPCAAGGAPSAPARAATSPSRRRTRRSRRPPTPSAPRGPAG